jgi:hypothetical protein
MLGLVVFSKKDGGENIREYKNGNRRNHQRKEIDQKISEQGYPGFRD